jgi:streptogramin lyase
MILCLFSCKKEQSNPEAGIQTNYKNSFPATPDPTFTTVSTYVGDGLFGDVNGPVNVARTDSPNEITTGPDGSLYFSEIGENKIRRISPDGIVSTFAGSGVFCYHDGPALRAQFRSPGGMVVTPDGIMYVCDALNNKIRKIENGIVTTFAGSPEDAHGDLDGVGQQARFYVPAEIALAPDGSLYVTDSFNSKIRKITPAGVVTTIAGSTEGFADGPGLLAQFDHPDGIVVLDDGTIVVADTRNSRIRKISPLGVVSTFVGGVEGYADGLGTSAKINGPMGITLAPNGTLYFSDNQNYRIRKISPSGLVTTIAGNGEYAFQDGPALQAKFNFAQGVAYLNNAIYVCDFGNSRIRKIQ